MTSRRKATRIPVPFSRHKLDKNAVGLVRRLQKAGYEAYLVGGCVRDLLLGHSPKDYDISTSATPGQVRRLFRRSRMIGRRFRIVHVYAGREIYEVSTFRAPPPGSDKNRDRAIRRDNEFGDLESDAFRRDFRVNALYLDPIAGQIVDWVGGMDDIEKRVLHSIGDPMVRFPEDPIRVLRLIKFFRRLQLEPGKTEIAAARDCAQRLRESAEPRVLEELFRLMSTGDMEGVWNDLEGLNVLKVILPEFAQWLKRKPEMQPRLLARFRALDHAIQDGAKPGYGFKLAILTGLLVEQELNPETRHLKVRETSQVPAAVLGAIQARARIPKTSVSKAARILQAQLRMDPPDWLSKHRKKGKRWAAARLIEQDFFPEALDYLRCRLEAEDRSLDIYDDWHEKSLSLDEKGR